MKNQFKGKFWLFFQEENLDCQQGVIDFSLYLRNKIDGEAASPKHEPTPQPTDDTKNIWIPRTYKLNYKAFNCLNHLPWKGLISLYPAVDCLLEARCRETTTCITYEGCRWAALDWDFIAMCLFQGKCGHLYLFNHAYSVKIIFQLSLNI